MKKVISLLAVAAFALAFVACGKKAEPAAEETAPATEEVAPADSVTTDSVATDSTAH